MSPDVFEAYSDICSANTRTHSSIGIPLVRGLFQTYTDLCSARVPTTLQQTVNHVPVIDANVTRLSNPRKRTAAVNQLISTTSGPSTSETARYSSVADVQTNTRLYMVPLTARLQFCIASIYVSFFTRCC